MDARQQLIEKQLARVESLLAANQSELATCDRTCDELTTRNQRLAHRKAEHESDLATLRYRLAAAEAVHAQFAAELKSQQRNVQLKHSRPRHQARQKVRAILIFTSLKAFFKRGRVAWNSTSKSPFFHTLTLMHTGGIYFAVRVRRAHRKMQVVQGVCDDRSISACCDCSRAKLRRWPEQAS